ncbi:MAG: multiprotein-bridging factor 1 [Watsoniomyces obsoletus]|nr:MAG: multiprotein-bridging factor 1 [Watsoniomyces obsoletus]
MENSTPRPTTTTTLREPPQLHPSIGLLHCEIPMQTRAMNAVAAALTGTERTESAYVLSRGDLTGSTATPPPRRATPSSTLRGGDSRSHNNSHGPKIYSAASLETSTSHLSDGSLNNNIGPSASDKTVTTTQIVSNTLDKKVASRNNPQSVSKRKEATMGANVSKLSRQRVYRSPDAIDPEDETLLQGSGATVDDPQKGSHTSNLGARDPTSGRRSEDSSSVQKGGVEDRAAATTTTTTTTAKDRPDPIEDRTPATAAMDPPKPNPTEDSTRRVLEGPQIRAFAKLEFEDGPFYMNTYAVLIGRDMPAAKAAARRKRKPGNPVSGSTKRSSASVGDLPKQPARGVKRDPSARYSLSLVSESGGVMGVDEPDADDLRWWRRPSSGLSGVSTRRNSTNGGDASSEPERIDREKVEKSAQEGLPQEEPPAKEKANEEPMVNPAHLLPSPEECPLIPIHPPAASIDTGGYRGISRRHVKIAYNFERHVFELQIFGRNGAFVNDRWHASGENVRLRSGAHVQVGGVGLRFVLPDGQEAVVVDEDEVVIEENNAEAVVVENDADGELNSGSDASGEEETGDDEQGVEADDGQDAEHAEDDDEDDDNEEEDEEEDDEEEEETPVELPQKRGPGRPPKHGRYMKKPRLEVQQPKAAPAAAVKPPVSKPGRKPKVKPVPEPVASPVTTEKRKVGRPRKHPLPEDTPPKAEKRKYVRRKGVEGTGDDNAGNEGKENTESTPVKEKKETKPKRPPRSPSPVFDESTLTEQDLAKPQSSYVVLIHDALTNSETGTLSLPQIYRAIERKYPYFKLRVTTNGWQSSVRHNLSQHDAFQKIERDGKGWVWGLVPGVSIEKEKRRKAVSPPVPSASQQTMNTLTGDQTGINTGLQLQGFGASPVQQQQQSTTAMARGIQPYHAHQPLGPPPPAQQVIRGGGTTPNGGYYPSPSYASPSPFQRPTVNNQLNLQQQQSPFVVPPNPASNGIRNVNTTPSSHTSKPGPAPGSAPAKFIGGVQGIQARQVALAAPAPAPSTSPVAVIGIGAPLAPPRRPSAPPQSSTPTPIPSTAPTTRPVNITPELLNAIQSFKNSLLKSLPKTVHSETVVQSAIDRALGLSNRSKLPQSQGGQEDPQELFVIKALNGIIHGEGFANLNGNGGGSGSSGGGGGQNGNGNGNTNGVIR